MKPPEPRRYAMYLRKSQEAEERQALSIPAQQRELEVLATRLGLVVQSPILEESMSAKRPGRPVFGALMASLQRGEVEGILCWHLDRLARNPKDGGEIMWAIGEGKIQEIVTPNAIYTGTPNDKLMMSIIFGMATKYSDDLAINIRRGNDQALLEGRWPSMPKLGYIRDRESGALVRDPDRFTKVRDLWRLRLDGLPISEIFARATTWGLTTARRRSVGGKPIVLDHVYRILHDQFYAGVMEYSGKTYKGSHEPMVSWSEFEAVQQAFAITKVTPTSCPKRLDFTYRGLVVCGRCRAVVTAETTTNPYGVRYTYYHCCRKSRRYNFCPERSVDERDLEAQIRAALCAVRIPSSLAAEALRIIERDLSERAEVRERFLEEVTNKRSTLSLKRRRLDDLLVDGHLTPDSHVARVEDVTLESRRLDEQVARLQAPEPLIEQLRAAISLVSEAEKCFDLAEPPERRDIVRKVFSNLSLVDRKLQYEAKKTIALLGDRTRILDVCSLLEAVGTSDLAPLAPAAGLLRRTDESG